MPGTAIPVVQDATVLPCLTATEIVAEGWVSS